MTAPTTEPSAGAMKAAEAIWAAASVKPVGFRPRRPQIAAIIDAETGLPELLVVCKARLEFLEGLPFCKLEASYEERDLLAAAIAKAEGAT